MAVNWLIGVFSDDFTTIDLCEELCKPATPKKQCSEGTDKAPGQTKYNKAIYTKNYERAKKRKISQAVQRETPLRSRFSVQPYYFVAACACLGEAQPSPLVIDKHTP